MPRSRGGRVSEMPQRQPPRGPYPLRISGSESDPLHQRPTVDRSPKLGDRRSPRGSQSDSLHQKKLGTRIADLESQLGQAQEELRKLKDQLDSAEVAKREAQEELDKKSKNPAIIPDTDTEDTPAPPQPPPTEVQESKEKNESNPDESLDQNLQETDVFEVPVTTLMPAKPNIEQEEIGTKQIDNCTEPPILEPEKTLLDDIALLNNEIDLLKAKLEEKGNEVSVVQVENERLNKKVTEAVEELTSAQVKQEETSLKLTKRDEELELSKADVVRLREELEVMETAKVELESEMKKLKVQTEQWKKAADAAAAVLASGVDMGGRVGKRCGSMDKHDSAFEKVGGYTGFEGSPLMNVDNLDDGFGSGKRKGSGIRVFGDLWKKKGQK